MSSGSLTRNAVRDALSEREYQFVSHGRSTARCPRPQRQEPSRRRGNPFAVNLPDQFDINDFARPERLHSVFRILEQEGGPGAGEDALTYSDFSTPEVFDALRAVSAAIRNGTYRPYPTRLVRIPKGDDRWRELRLLRIMDRVVAKALQIALDEYWQLQLPGIGRDVWHIYADMQHVMREHRAYVLAIDDIRACFPSAPLDTVMECHRQHISQSDLLWLIETAVRGHDGPGHRIGLDQGSPYSPVAMELLLHTHLDARLEAVFQGFPLLLRYVDNLTFVCGNEHEGQQALQVAEDILADLGFCLKREDGPPRDIRDASFNQAVLGLIPRWRNGQLTLSIPESAFDDLRDGLSEASMNRRPVKTARAVANGWINSVGPALVRQVAPVVIDRVISIARECGFIEIPSRELSETAQRARHRWLALCENRSDRP